MLSSVLLPYWFCRFDKRDLASTSEEGRHLISTTIVLCTTVLGHRLGDSLNIDQLFKSVFWVIFTVPLYWVVMFGVICSFLVLGCFALILTLLVTETMSIRTETRLPVFWVSLHSLQVLPDWSCSQSSMGRGGARQGAATQAVMLHGIWLPVLHFFCASIRNY